MMTAPSETLVKAPLFGIMALAVASLTLLVAAGPAIAAERTSAAVVGSFQTPPADPQDADAA
jgi:hypothetical protein